MGGNTTAASADYRDLSGTRGGIGHLHFHLNGPIRDTRGINRKGRRRALQRLANQREDRKTRTPLPNHLARFEVERSLVRRAHDALVRHLRAQERRLPLHRQPQVRALVGDGVHLLADHLHEHGLVAHLHDEAALVRRLELVDGAHLLEGGAGRDAADRGGGALGRRAHAGTRERGRGGGEGEERSHCLRLWGLVYIYILHKHFHGRAGCLETVAKVAASVRLRRLRSVAAEEIGDVVAKLRKDLVDRGRCRRGRWRAGLVPRGRVEKVILRIRRGSVDAVVGDGGGERARAVPV
mmetsp:Transcript_21035/g.68072  ORF Transcript_21035/g.68072 Transcript_21035/m.68072 type:complete len:295 (-) Transcript_21035:2243-3127(-)